MTQQFPPPHNPYGPPPQWAPPQTGSHRSGPSAKRKKWPWVVGVLATLWLIGTVTGGEDPQGVTAAGVPTVAPTPTIQAAAPPASTSTAPPEPTIVTLPKVKGRNGGIVYDELQDLGLTNVQLASGDQLDTVVLLPANWTAVTIEPKPGTKVSSDDTVVVTMTKD